MPIYATGWGLEPALQENLQKPELDPAGGRTILNAKQPTKPHRALEVQTQRAIERIAESGCPVLIVGERGVGKRSVAGQIHAQSHQSHGAFTEVHGADANAASIEAALRTVGTLYLVEVGDLSLAAQEQLLEAFLHCEATQSCRLVCGTCRELVDEVKSRRMREDFFHAISGVTLRVPPLRCRRSEILSIAEDLLTQYSEQFDRPKPVLRKEILGFLMKHNWPGNLLELQTAIKTFVAIGDQTISLAALKAAAPVGRPNGNHKPQSLKQATRTALLQIERQLISEMLATTGGNRKRAADELGISYKALLYKLKLVGSESQPALNKNGVAS